jgi:hypothetical protein
MRRSFRFCALILASFLLGGEPAVSGQRMEVGDYWESHDAYHGNGAADSYGPYPDPYMEYGPREYAPSWEQERGWSQHPNRLQWDLGQEDNLFAEPERSEGRTRDYPSGSLPASGEYGYMDDWPARRGKSRMPEKAYRFRGDEPDEFGRESLRNWRQIYRFRPLTDQEHRRLGGETGWRRHRSPGGEDGFHSSERGLPVEESYGYQPDGRLYPHYETGP